MEITTRGLWTLIHGMGFGTLYLLGCSGVLVELYRCCSTKSANPVAPRDTNFLKVYLVIMSVLAWLTVITGAYIIYPWYRAVAPVGIANLAAFPQKLLQSNPATSGWHTLGMEWKEHVAWLTPISITMAAAVVIRYGRDLKNHPQLRAAVLCFTLVSFLAAGIAGFFGAMLVKNAPVEGGRVIHLMDGE
jgi:hypothetical protein